MSRQKKESKATSLLMDAKIAEMLDEYCEETGQSKTGAIERILRKSLEYYFAQTKGSRIPY